MVSDSASVDGITAGMYGDYEAFDFDDRRGAPQESVEDRPGPRRFFTSRPVSFSVSEGRSAPGLFLDPNKHPPPTTPTRPLFGSEETIVDLPSIGIDPLTVSLYQMELDNG